MLAFFNGKDGLICFHDNLALKTKFSCFQSSFGITFMIVLQKAKSGLIVKLSIYKMTSTGPESVRIFLSANMPIVIV